MVGTSMVLMIINCKFSVTIENEHYSAPFVEIVLLCETIKQGLYGATVIVIQQMFKSHENTTIIKKTII